MWVYATEVHLLMLPIWVFHHMDYGMDYAVVHVFMLPIWEEKTSFSYSTIL